MIFDAIISIVSIIVCAILASVIGRTFFGDHDDSKMLRRAVTVVSFIALMSIARAGLDSLFYGVDIEKELQSDPMFQVLKVKHPNDYQSIVTELKKLEDKKMLTQEQVIAISQQKMSPIINRLLIQSGDQSRHQFASASVETLSILKSRDDTACYDSMFNPQAMASKMALAHTTFKESGMDTAMIAVINDSGIDKAVVSEKKVQETVQNVFTFLARKHGEEANLLFTPEKAITTEQKRKVCQITMDFYTFLNDPNDKVKMATLRRSMEEASKLSSTTSTY